MPSLRRALRDSLAEIDPDSKKSETFYQTWARKLRDDAITAPQKLELAKFLEGATPPESDLPKPELDDAEPNDSDGNTLDP